MEKELTLTEFRTIIREEAMNLKRRLVLENEKKQLQKELNELLNESCVDEGLRDTGFGKMFGMKSSDEKLEDKKEKINEINEELNGLIGEKSEYGKSEKDDLFLRKVKSENPDMFMRFLNIVKNKGIDIAKERYKEFDPEEIERNSKEEKKDKYIKWLLESFVKSLPKKLPELINKFVEKENIGIDSATYMLIGVYIDKYEKRWGKEKADIIDDNFDTMKYEIFFWGLIDEKYGEHVIEW